ncbi:hypothetical protein [Nocardia sp. NPDC058497]|uniref:hypothetical protein n=1 Tax=Nocardia sp. NPDC058497 TaxID=3346529 RepID=UPI003652055F
MDELSQRAAELVRAALDGDDELGNAALQLTNSVSADELVDVVLEMIGSCGRHLADQNLSEAALGFQAFTDDDMLGVDEVHPAVRATSRALLCTMDGDEESARLQIDTVIRMGHYLECAAVVTMAASWHAQSTAAFWWPAGVVRSDDVKNS